MYKIYLMPRHFYPLGRFFLKGVENPYVRADLHRIDDAKCITSMPQYNLHHATPEALQWLYVVGLSALGRHGQRPQTFDLHRRRKRLEILPCGLDP